MTNAPKVITVPSGSKEWIEKISKFYISVGYPSKITQIDSFVIALENNKIIGAVRMCVENEIHLLRGMHVNPKYQRSGIGLMILSEFERMVNGLGIQEMYCIPWSYLETFYGKMGFRRIEPNKEVPAFLAKRLSEYQTKYGNMILMRRNQKYKY